jgi:hypothetical protein
MIFNAAERAILAALADVLIPAGEGFPSASEAGVAGEGLDQVLSVRPDLSAGLKQLLASATGQPPAGMVSNLRTENPTAFGILTEVVPAAYFLNPEVRTRLGYHGQTPRAIDPRPDYLEDGLLQSVIDRGPIYRPTPGEENHPP